MQFKDIVGQRDVINRLTETVDNGRVAHAQLLLGATGEGAMQIALAYLQYLCCEHRHHHDGGDLRADSCGECPSCKKIGSLMHPDLNFIFPTAATKSVDKNYWSGDFAGEYRNFLLEKGALGTVDEWYAYIGIENKQAMIREADATHMVETLSLKAYEGGWKMMVVWMPEKMNPTASNKLLKTLEEPTGRTILLLVGENDEALLPTIRSRVQTYRLHPRGTRPGGAMADTFAPLLVEWLRMLFKLKMKELATEVEKLAAMNREETKLFLAYTLSVMGDCFMNTAAGTECHIGSGDEKFDAMFPRMITMNNIELVNDALNEAIMAIGRNANQKIALMELSFRMSKALKKR